MAHGWDRGKATYLLGKPSNIVPWNTTEADPAPMFRAQAWALEAAHNAGARFEVSSAIRSDDVLAWFNREYGTNHSGQQYLYDHQHDPGFYPANPPTRTSHCGWQDGSTFYPHVGQKLNYLKYGLDCTDDGSNNDASRLVHTLNSIGVPAAKAYPGESSENHHIVILATAFQCWNALYKQRKKKNKNAWDNYTWKKRPMGIRAK